MHKQITTALMIGLMVAASPSRVRAQDVPTATMDPALRDDNVGQTAGTTNNQVDGFDWRWLLPLLAIPLLFWFLIDRANKETDRPTFRNQRMAGSKGGEARFDDDDEI